MASFDNIRYWKSYGQNGSFAFPNSCPVDDRYVVANYSNILNINENRRYPGLRIYALDTEKEYWFKSGVTDADLVEYKPWEPKVVPIPDNYEGTAEQYLATNENPATTKEVYVVTIKNGNYVYTHYAYLNNGWHLIQEPVEDSEEPETPEPGRNIIVVVEKGTSVATALSSQTPTTGLEATVITTETDPITNTDTQVYSKYVYINNNWCIAHGSQVITFSLAGYDSSDDWESYVPAQASNDILYKKLSTGKLRILIRHGFCSQYVDVSLYLTDTDNLDNDINNTDEPYGEELLVNNKCTKLNGVDGYWVVVDLQAPITNSTYTLLLQR